MRRKTLGTAVLALVLPLTVSILNFSCAETPNDQHVRIVRNAEPEPVRGGIPPDKQADIQLVLQERDTMTLKCYQDVLNEKHDRAFKGSVLVMLTVEPSGQASNVSVVGGTLNNPEVSQCLVEKIKEFEFPTIPNKGSMQYEYRFQPAY
jgi:hypothetical protein